MTRPVDRWDYDGDCPACFLGQPHQLSAHDAALAEYAEEEERMGLSVEEFEIVCAISFQAGVSIEEARQFVESGS